MRGEGAGSVAKLAGGVRGWRRPPCGSRAPRRGAVVGELPRGRCDDEVGVEAAGAGGDDVRRLVGAVGVLVGAAARAVRLTVALRRTALPSSPSSSPRPLKCTLASPHWCLSTGKMFEYCSPACRCFSEDVLGSSEFAGNKERGAARGEANSSLMN